MQMETSNKSRLGTYVFLALIVGLIAGQTIRFFTNDQETLNDIAANFNIAATLFLRLIKMIIAPLVFSTLVVGIYKLGDSNALGRIFFKTMFIFICGGFISLIVGLIIVDIFQPGRVLSEAIMTAHPHLTTGSAQNELASKLSLLSFMEQIIPNSVAESFANNHIIQVVVFAIFFGVAGIAIGKPVQPVFDFFELIGTLMFKITDYVMKFAPIAVFGAISSMIISSGFSVISSYFLYMSEFVLATSILWAIMILIGFIIIKSQIFILIKSLADSLGISFSTSSSEAVLPNVLEELEKFGVTPRVSGFVLPMGYSFNLVASMLNCIFATMFIVQLYGFTLTIWQQITMLLMLMVTSKGIAGIPRASLVIVAATLTSMGLPDAAVLILFPIDGFLDMIRSATNVFANSLSAVFVDKWEKNKIT